jgi:hypothetical protein
VVVITKRIGGEVCTSCDPTTEKEGRTHGEVRPRRVAMATSIGIMDGAYFMGRDEILHCINATFQLSLVKVQEDVL